MKSSLIFQEYILNKNKSVLGLQLCMQCILWSLEKWKEQCWEDVCDYIVYLWI